MLFPLLAVSLLIGVSLQTPVEQNVDDLVKYINSIQNDWTAGNNGKLSSFEGKLGLLPLKEPMLEQLPEIDYDSLDIPESFDSREHWSKCPNLKEVRDQGACGSCWAFAAVEAITDRICIASDGKDQPWISAEDVNDCCDSCGMGCNGGFPEAVFEYWVSDGIVTGGLYDSKIGCQPYSIKSCEHHTTGHLPACGATVPTPECKQSCREGYNGTYSKDKWYGSKAYGVSSNVKAIQTEIMTHGPVATGFTVYEDFLTYKAGVYHHVHGIAKGGHAVKILGWGVENGNDYWLVANSWNPDWGDKGYFKIRRGNNEGGIESRVSAGLPK